VLLNKEADRTFSQSPHDSFFIFILKTWNCIW